MRYAVIAQAKDDDTFMEVVSTHDTREEAQAMLDKCREGDDKHDPCDYFIEQVG